jgi:antitoxin MazE
MSKTATLTQWGNAQGIRIPKTFCRQLGLSVGDKISMEIEKGKIILYTTPDEAYTLKARREAWDGKGSALPELDWGEPVGKELW